MARKRRRMLAEINVVPYIDVMLVLLVIFMVTVPLVHQGVELELPQANAESLPATESGTLIFSINAQGSYFLHLAGEPPVAVDEQIILERTSAILERDPQTPVLVRAHADIAYGEVIKAMVLLQQAGAAKVGLSTQPPEQ